MAIEVEDKELQLSECRLMKPLESALKKNVIEVEDDVGSRTCEDLEEEPKAKKPFEQLLRVGVHGEPNLSTTNKPMLTVIVSLCGLLLRRCWQKSNKMQSLKCGHEFVVLRPGCIKFLRTLLNNFNVGIWSAANDKFVVDIIKILEKEAGEKLSFFMIWGQSQCQACETLRITRPDNPGVEALFKPLAYASAKFGFDARRTLLVDDTPLKGSVNPTSSCVFPPSFNIDEEDNVLLGELLPYLDTLHHVSDIRTVISSSLYGQAPIVQGHELYNHVQPVVLEWEEQNKAWNDRNYTTGRLLEAARDSDGEKGATSSTTSGVSTRSRDRTKITLDREKLRLLKSVKSIATMKGIEAIMLAGKLGYKGTVVKPHEAKTYLKQVQKQYNLN